VGQDLIVSFGREWRIWRQNLAVFENSVVAIDGLAPDFVGVDRTKSSSAYDDSQGHTKRIETAQLSVQQRRMLDDL